MAGVYYDRGAWKAPINHPPIVPTSTLFHWGKFVRCDHPCRNVFRCGLGGGVSNCDHFSQLILISFSSTLNSGSPVRSSEPLILASAAAKQSA